MSIDAGEVINAAGRDLSRIWRGLDYDDHAFPEAAENILEKSELHEVLDMRTLARWLILARPYPGPGPNSGTSFGEPAVTLYSDLGAGFIIEALVWLDGTTAIHDHAFTGAFMVAQGASIHSTFSFSVSDRVRDRLQLGDMKWNSSELLRRGQIRRINSGSKFIHSLFHLDRPSITVIARTLKSPGVQQYSYTSPGVAVDPFYKPEPLETQIRMLASLMVVDRNLLQEAAELQLAAADLWTTQRILRLLHPRRERIINWNGLVDGAAERHGTHRVEKLLSSFSESERIKEIIALRRKVKDPDHRFLLALLLNVPDRAAILDLVSARHPNADPAEQALSWLQEITATPGVNLQLSAATADLIR